ncbi:hypothetical protein KKE03_05180 [Patescibacteria group bacterium]|nr:hypothetical protein [Patescibacteria group bacterium]
MNCEVCRTESDDPGDPYKRLNLLFGMFSTHLNGLNLETYHLSEEDKVRFALDRTLRYAIDQQLGLTQGLERVNGNVKQYAILFPLPINFRRQVSEYLGISLASWTYQLRFADLPGIASDQEVKLYSKLNSVNSQVL